MTTPRRRGSLAYDGRIMHSRLTGPRHRFSHGVTFFAIALDEDGPGWPVGYERRAPLALRAADHWGHEDRSVQFNYREALRNHGLDPDGRGVLVTQLRQLGYVFNPISLIYWYRGDALTAVIAEVANTFGQRHLYAFDARATPAGASGLRTFHARKALHVSPFLGMDHDYTFTLSEPGPRFHAAITLRRGGEVAFHSTWTGVGRPLTRLAAARALLRRPLMPLMVTGLIHLQALRLWRKGARFHRTPSFRPGRGTSPPSVAPPGRRALHPPPPARVSPLSPVVRAASGLVLRRRGEGDLAVTWPDGHTHTTRGHGRAPAVRLTINSRDLFHRVARRGTTGVGEAYVAGDWDAEDLPGAMRALLTRARDLTRHPVGRAGIAIRTRRPRRAVASTRERAAHEVRYHYDLGNDLYRLFLDDETLSYSAAVFAHPGQALADAQRAKLRGILDALDLRPGQRVLEIGCGWGGFAVLAAEERGVDVTGLTLSRDQHAIAAERARASSACDRIDVRIEDYRDHRGAYDAVVSIEMIEAIGHDELPGYFAAIDGFLQPGGRAFVQAISIPDDRYERYRRSRDWISEYIFPGGCCPSLEAMRAALEPTDLVIRRHTDVGAHYATTLAHWLERFDANLDRVRALGFDERFVRGWRFYLASCQAAFACGNIHDRQLVLDRPSERSG